MRPWCILRRAQAKALGRPPTLFGGVLLISSDLEVRSRYCDLFVKTEPLDKVYPGSRLRRTGPTPPRHSGAKEMCRTRLPRRRSRLDRYQSLLAHILRKLDGRAGACAEQAPETSWLCPGSYPAVRRSVVVVSPPIRSLGSLMRLRSHVCRTSLL